jgi:CBS domain containing-hemolysin-like protein
MYIVIVVLLMLSGIFSGLNLGLMSLDTTELTVVLNSGTPREIQYARGILPIRKHGNFLLCTLLLGNTAVNAMLAIFIEMVAGGFVAGIVTTFAIVIFGEIIPQSVCARYALAIGYHTRYIVLVFMVLTAPISFPFALVLDCILGEEIGGTMTKKQLRAFMDVELQAGQVSHKERALVSGALDLHTKKVKEMMIELAECFMLSTEQELDFKTVNEIFTNGHSRVPVYKGVRSNIIGVVHAKDLMVLDFRGESLSVATLMRFYTRPMYRVTPETNAMELLTEFTDQNRHIAIVSKDGKANSSEACGIVTMEDVLQVALLEQTGNTGKAQKRGSGFQHGEVVSPIGIGGGSSGPVSPTRPVIKQHKSSRLERQATASPRYAGEGGSNPTIQDLMLSATGRVSGGQEKLPLETMFSTFIFLSSNVTCFVEASVVPGFLLAMKTVLEGNVLRVYTSGEKIYTTGDRTDVFTLILDGNVQVQKGTTATTTATTSSATTTMSGPWTVFGEEALQQDGYAATSTITAAGRVECVHITREVHRTLLLGSAAKSAVALGSHGVTV